MTHYFQDKISSFVRSRLFRIRFSRLRICGCSQKISEPHDRYRGFEFLPDHIEFSVSALVSILEDCYLRGPLRATVDLHNSQNGQSVT
jgi:hypothetical protein